MGDRGANGMRTGLVLRGGAAGAVIALVLSACSGGGSGGEGGDGDAGVDDAFPTPPDIPWLDDGVPPIAPPDIPWLADGVPPIAPPDIPWLEGGVPPIAWTCPAGWRRVAEDGVGTCEPYPEGGARECPEGEADFLGETGGASGCAPIGRACGAETFPPVDDVPADTAVRYVLAGALPGGDGSPGSPFATLAAALDAASPGTELVLGAGSYEVDRAWPEDVSVRGRCARETVLVSEAEAGSQEAVLTVTGGTVVARDLRIGPSARVGVQATGADTRLELHGVWVTEATHRGVEVGSGAQLEATLLVVDDTRERAGDPETRGMEVSSGASATISGALLRRNHGVGLWVFDFATTLQAHDVGIVGSRAGLNGSLGLGLWMERGSEVSVVRGLIEGNRTIGVFAADPRTRLELRGTVIRDTLPRESDGALGVGVQLQRGAKSVVERTLIEGNRNFGLWVIGTDTTLELRDAVVRDTLPGDSSGGFGNGLNARTGAVCVVERVHFERNQEIGIFASGPETTLHLRDAVVRDTLPQQTDGERGRGLDVRLGAAAVVERALFEQNRHYGVNASDTGTTLDLSDVLVRDTLAGKNGVFGVGLNVLFGASAAVERVLLERNRQAGVRVSSGAATLELRDAVVRDTLPDVRNGEVGLGLVLQPGASAVVERALFEGNRLSGVYAGGADTTLALQDVVVRDTLPQESDGLEGRGFVADLGASATIERALFERNRNLGVSADGVGTTLEAQDLVVRNTRSEAVTGSGGAGLTLLRGAVGVVEQALFERNRNNGILVALPETALELHNVVVRNTLPQDSDGLGGRGFTAQQGASAVMSNAVIEGSREVGVFASEPGTVLELHDAVIQDTLSREVDGERGTGLVVQTGAAAVIARSLVERNREVGVQVGGSEATLQLRDVVVSDTSAPACSPNCASFLNYGTGLASLFEARLTMTGFSLERNDLCGVLLGSGGGADLDNGVVSDHPTAVCLQVPGFDTRRLLQNVQYVDNGRLVEATDLVLPRPVEVVDPVPR